MHLPCLYSLDLTQIQGKQKKREEVCSHDQHNNFFHFLSTRHASLPSFSYKFVGWFMRKSSTFVTFVKDPMPTLIDDILQRQLMRRRRPDRLVVLFKPCSKIFPRLGKRVTTFFFNCNFFFVLIKLQ